MLPCDLSEKFSDFSPTVPCEPGVLFEYFLSQLAKAGLVAISVRGIPENVEANQLLPVILDESLDSGASLSFIDKPYSSQVKAFSEQYRQEFAASDSNFLYSIATKKSFLYDFARAPEGCREFYLDSGIQTTLVVPVHSPGRGGWKLRIILHSLMNNDELSQVLYREKQLFSNEIRHLYLELMDQYEDILRPAIPQGIKIHDHARATIELLAEGHSTKVIASKLRLTEKGVDYHLNVLREKLNARNRTHLVSQAFRLGLL